MPKNTDYQKLMQRHLAQVIPNGSSLRNQGVKGMVAAAQAFLETMDIGRFVTASETSFQKRLDEATEALRLAFPKGGRNFGSARKILNIFLRDALYNRFLYQPHRLSMIEAWLEVPLDSHVASHLQAEAGDTVLPRWDSITRLTPHVSHQYQRVATEAARKRKALRADLDLLWWRNPRKTKQ